MMTDSDGGTNADYQGRKDALARAVGEMLMEWFPREYGLTRGQAYADGASFVANLEALGYSLSPEDPAVGSWPQFGAWVENTYASTTNPFRRGMFVRKGRHTGRLNPGPWWELTDGHGEFWQVKPDNCRPPKDDGYCGPLSGAPE